MPQPNLIDLVNEAKQRHHAEVGTFGKPIDSMTAAERAAALESIRAAEGSIGSFLAGQADSVSALLDLAETAPPVHIRHPGGDPENIRIEPALPPSANVRLSRELLSVGKPAEVTGVHYSGLQPAVPGEVIQLRAALMAESAFCRAGGHLMIDEPVPLVLKEEAGRERRDVLVERPRQLRSITPLTFTKQTTAGQAAPVSPWPALSSDAVGGITSAVPGSAFMDTYLARVRLTRKQQAMLPRSMWAFEVSVALATGLARLCDSVAFGRLENLLTAGAWSWSWPAAKGIAHSELKAVIGSSAIGAQVRQDGMLSYGGLCEAELTPTMGATLVGDWRRAAVFVRDDVTLVAKRDSTTGDVDLTAFASLRFECPDLEFFKKVSA